MQCGVVCGVDVVGCRSEVDEYGYRWWGVKVYKTEVIETPGGQLKRFCKASGWGDYDGSSASSGLSGAS